MPPSAAIICLATDECLVVQAALLAYQDLCKVNSGDSDPEIAAEAKHALTVLPELIKRSTLVNQTMMGIVPWK